MALSSSSWDFRDMYAWQYLECPFTGPCHALYHVLRENGYAIALPPDYALPTIAKDALEVIQDREGVEIPRRHADIHHHHHHSQSHGHVSHHGGGFPSADRQSAVGGVGGVGGDGSASPRGSVGPNAAQTRVSDLTGYGAADFHGRHPEDDDENSDDGGQRRQHSWDGLGDVGQQNSGHHSRSRAQNAPAHFSSAGGRFGGGSAAQNHPHPHHHHSHHHDPSSSMSAATSTVGDTTLDSDRDPRFAPEALRSLLHTIATIVKWHILIPHGFYRDRFILHAEPSSFLDYGEMGDAGQGASPFDAIPATSSAFYPSNNPFGSQSSTSGGGSGAGMVGSGGVSHDGGLQQAMSAPSFLHPMPSGASASTAAFLSGAMDHQSSSSNFPPSSSSTATVPGKTSAVAGAGFSGFSGIGGVSGTEQRRGQIGPHAAGGGGGGAVGGVRGSFGGSPNHSGALPSNPFGGSGYGGGANMSSGVFAPSGPSDSLFGRSQSVATLHRHPSIVASSSTASDSATLHKHGPGWVNIQKVFCSSGGSPTTRSGGGSGAASSGGTSATTVPHTPRISGRNHAAVLHSTATQHGGPPGVKRVGADGHVAPSARAKSEEMHVPFFSQAAKGPGTNPFSKVLLSDEIEVTLTKKQRVQVPSPIQSSKNTTSCGKLPSGGSNGGGVSGSGSKAGLGKGRLSPSNSNRASSPTGPGTSGLEVVDVQEKRQIRVFVLDRPLTAGREDSLPPPLPSCGDDGDSTSAIDVLYQLDRDSLRASLEADVLRIRDHYVVTEGYESALYERVQRLIDKQESKWVAKLGTDTICIRRLQLSAQMAVDSFVHARLYQIVIGAVSDDTREEELRIKAGASNLFETKKTHPSSLNDEGSVSDQANGNASFDGGFYGSGPERSAAAYSPSTLSFLCPSRPAASVPTAASNLGGVGAGLGGASGGASGGLMQLPRGGGGSPPLPAAAAALTYDNYIAALIDMEVPPEVARVISIEPILNELMLLNTCTTPLGKMYRIAQAVAAVEKCVEDATRASPATLSPQVTPSTSPQSKGLGSREATVSAFEKADLEKADLDKAETMSHKSPAPGSVEKRNGKQRDISRTAQNGEGTKTTSKKGKEKLTNTSGTPQVQRRESASKSQPIPVSTPRRCIHHPLSNSPQPTPFGDAAANECDDDDDDDDSNSSNSSDDDASSCEKSNSTSHDFKIEGRDRALLLDSAGEKKKEASPDPRFVEGDQSDAVDSDSSESDASVSGDDTSHNNAPARDCGGEDDDEATECYTETSDGSFCHRVARSGGGGGADLRADGSMSPSRGRDASDALGGKGAVVGADLGVPLVVIACAVYVLRDTKPVALAAHLKFAELFNERAQEQWMYEMTTLRLAVAMLEDKGVVS